jgi:hypothetical protein
MPDRPPAAVRLGLLLAVLGASSAPALAAARFACTANNGPFGISADVQIGPGEANPIDRVGGAITLKTREVPPDLARLDLDTPALVHHWYEGEQLNLHFYKERASTQPGGAVEAILTLRRPNKDDDAYRGRFRIKVRYFKKASDAQPMEFMVTGGATCTGTGT